MKIFLSPIAERKTELLLEFIENEWSKNVKEKFLEKFKKSVKTVSNQPKSFPVSKSMKGLFKCVVSKQTSFYYRIINNEIEIITLIDNRQNPKEIFKELKSFFAKQKLLF